MKFKMATSSLATPGPSHRFLTILLICAIYANNSLAQNSSVKESIDQLPSGNSVVKVDGQRENVIVFPQQSFDSVCAVKLRKNLIKFLGRVTARQDEEGGIAGFLQTVGNIGAFIGNALTTEGPDYIQEIVIGVSQVAGAVNQGLNGTDTPNITSFLIKQGQQFIQALLGNRGQTQNQNQGNRRPQNQNQGNRRPQRPTSQVQKLPATIAGPSDFDEDEINEISVVVDAETTKGPETGTTNLPFSKLVANRHTTIRPPLNLIGNEPQTEQESAEQLISALFSLVPSKTSLTTTTPPKASLTKQPTTTPTTFTTTPTTGGTRPNPLLQQSVQQWLAALQAAKLRSTTTRAAIRSSTTPKWQRQPSSGGLPDSAEGGSIKQEIPKVPASGSGGNPIYWMNMFYPSGIPPRFTLIPSSVVTTPTTVKPRRRRTKSTTTAAPEYYDDDDSTTKKPKVEE